MITGEDLYLEYLNRQRADPEQSCPFEFIDPEVAKPWEMVANAINSLKMADPLRNIRAIRPGNALP